MTNNYKRSPVFGDNEGIGVQLNAYVACGVPTCNTGMCEQPATAAIRVHGSGLGNNRQVERDRDLNP